MTEMEEFRLRLTAVENEQATIREYASKGQRAFDMFTAIDRDLADVRIAFHQQRTMLNAIGLTQAEHTVTLREQSKILGGLVIEVAGHGKTLDGHTRTLAGHTRTLDGHTRMLDGHTRTLAEHTRTLDGHTRTLAEHTRTLDGHTRTLAEHGKVLGEHTIMLEEQSKMLCEQGTTLNEHTTTLSELKEQGSMMRDQLREILGRLPAAGG